MPVTLANQATIKQILSFKIKPLYGFFIQPRPSRSTTDQANFTLCNQ
jgi:hypothetical protein